MIPNYSIIHAAFFTPIMRQGKLAWGAPLLSLSDPGMAKTSAHRAYAASVSAPFAWIAPGAMGEGGYGMVPVPVPTEGGGYVLMYPAPDWAIKLGNFGLVLNDEITTAPPVIKPAQIALMLDGQIGGYAFGPRVRIMNAANPVGSSASGYELSAPEANRVIHVPFTINVADVCAYLTSGSQAGGDLPAIDALAEEKRVLDAWPEAMARAAGKIAAFLTRHPDLLYKLPQEGDPNRGKAWPSPRSWEMATRMLASSAVHSLSETDRDTVCAGCVGDAAWSEFLTYMASMDLPDPAEVLDGKSPWAPDPVRLDVTAAVLSACTALVAPKDAAKRTDRAVALWTLLDKVGKAGARDLTIAPATALVRGGLAQAPIARTVLADQRLSGLASALGAGGR